MSAARGRVSGPLQRIAATFESPDDLVVQARPLLGVFRVPFRRVPHRRGVDAVRPVDRVDRAHARDAVAVKELRRDERVGLRGRQAFAGNRRRGVAAAGGQREGEHGE